MIALWIIYSLAVLVTVKECLVKEGDALFYRNVVKDMFSFAFDNYMDFGFPEDELDPISCSGKSRNREVYDQGLNDVLGDFMLTLVDSMDTFAVMGNVSEFSRAVNVVVENLSFEKDNIVQVFEVNIRVLGSLISSHLLAKYPISGGGPGVKNYDDGLLALAVDLADRLLPAFESPTGLPYPRVNLMHGVPVDSTSETCTAGAGTLILEFGMLSRLTGNPIYEEKAKVALKALWFRRSEIGLFGNGIDANSGTWTQGYSGIGAGIDSIFEYMLKAYILFEDDEYLVMFQECYQAIMKYMRDPHGDLYYTVDMKAGSVSTQWIDSLGAFFPGLLVLYGDLENAIRAHSMYLHVWLRYGALPERFDFIHKSLPLTHYPLRPELIESTYFLYLATKDSYFLEVGIRFIEDLLAYTKTRCGFAGLGDVESKRKDARMETFFLSETLKYLYLLFDTDNFWNRDLSNFVFSTEAHIFYIPKELKQHQNPSPKSSVVVDPARKTCELQYQHKLPWSSIYYQVDHRRLAERVGNGNLTQAFPIDLEKYQLESGNLSKCPIHRYGSILEQASGDKSGIDGKNQENWIKVEISSGNPEHEVIRKLFLPDIFLYSHFNHTPIHFALRVVDSSSTIQIDLVHVDNRNVADKCVFVVDSGANDRSHVYRKKTFYKPVLSTLLMEKSYFVLIQANFGPRLWPSQAMIGNLEAVLFEEESLLLHGCQLVPKTKSLFRQLQSHIAGKVLFVKRGSCFFSEKTRFGEHFGAKAVIVYNHEDSGLLWMIPSNSKEIFSIPTFFLTIWQFRSLTEQHCNYSLVTLGTRRIRKCTLASLKILPGFDTSLFGRKEDLKTPASAIVKDLIGNMQQKADRSQIHDRLVFQNYVVRNAFALHWPLIVYEGFSMQTAKHSSILNRNRDFSGLEVAQFCYQNYGSSVATHECRNDGSPCLIKT